MERYTVRLDDVDSKTLKQIGIEMRGTPTDVFRRLLLNFRDAKSREFVSPADLETLRKEVKSVSIHSQKTVDKLAEIDRSLAQKIEEIEKKVSEIGQGTGSDSSDQVAELAATHKSLADDYSTLKDAFGLVFRELANQSGGTLDRRNSYVSKAAALGIKL